MFLIVLKVKKAVDNIPWNLVYVPDWFITPEMIGKGDEFREWFNGYKQRKAKKAQIKAELLPITWHPDRVIDWCF